jgi:hypothetical protein
MNPANALSPRSLFGAFSGACILCGLLLLSGCAEPESHPVEPTSEWDEPAQTGEYAEPGEEVIRDTAFIVKERRQAGGQLVADPSDVSAFDGRPRMKRTPLEHMIIVQGNQTGQEKAFLLPQSDFNLVREGQHLQESTLTRWESTSLDHIPAPAPPPENQADGSQRSRAGGADGNLAY